MRHKPILEVVEYIYPFIVKKNNNKQQQQQKKKKNKQTGAFAPRPIPFPCSPSLEAYFKVAENTYTHIVVVCSDLISLSTIFPSYHDGVWLRQGAQCSLL